MFYCILTQLLTVELYIMILEVTLTCILMQDEYLERLIFSSVSFTILCVDCHFLIHASIVCSVLLILLIDYTY